MMQTRCSDEDISDYVFGLTCLSTDGPQRHVFGPGSFAPEETFDTLIVCEECGRDDGVPLPVQGSLATTPAPSVSPPNGTVELAHQGTGDMRALTSDIAELKTDMQTLAAKVEELNRRVFATTLPPTPAVPKTLVSQRSVSRAVAAPVAVRARHPALRSHAAKARLVRRVRGSVRRHAHRHRDEEEEEEDEETNGAETYDEDQERLVDQNGDGVSEQQRGTDDIDRDGIADDEQDSVIEQAKDDDEDGGESARPSRGGPLPSRVDESTREADEADEDESDEDADETHDQ